MNKTDKISKFRFSNYALRPKTFLTIVINNQFSMKICRNFFAVYSYKENMRGNQKENRKKIVTKLRKKKDGETFI